jgi:hypothetical protein
MVKSIQSHGFAGSRVESPGIEQGKYYLITANSKVGKTQIADHLFLYNSVKQMMDNDLDIRLKIFYFSLRCLQRKKC